MKLPICDDFFFIQNDYFIWFNLVLVVKNPPTNAGKIPWRRAWHPTPVFLPGESHWQRSLVGYSPWVHKESDMTEVTACDGSKAVGLPFKV